MNRRTFLGVGAFILPAFQSIVAEAQVRKIQTVVKVITSTMADGTIVEAYSEVKRPDGKPWTAKQIKQNGFKLIERTAQQVRKGQINK